MISKLDKRKFFAYLVFSLFLLIGFASLVTSAVYKQWEAVELSHPIRLDGAVDSSIEANITITNPLGEKIVSFDEMLFDEERGEHNYTVASGLSGEIGDYPYCISATNGSKYKTECFSYTVTPSGQRGLLGFYFLVIILSYGVMGVGLWKKDITITMLGSFALFFLGLYMLFYGIDIFKNTYTDGFAWLTLGVAMYVTARGAYEYLI